MTQTSESIFDHIAKLLPPDLQPHFFRRIAHLRDLSPDDDMLLIAEAMGFLAILIRDTPPLIASERRSLEASLHETLTAMEGLHRTTVESNTRMEDRLLDLPGDIQAGINPDAIASKIAESIRQAFVQTELPGIVRELQLYAGNLSDSTHQLASLATALNDPHSGAPARLQHALSSMLANLANAATHIRCLATDLNREIRHAVVFLCSAALLLGFFIGWCLHQ